MWHSGACLPRAAWRPRRSPSALADEVAVQLLLDLVQAQEGRAVRHLFLPVPTGRTSHDIDRIEVVVATVGVGGVVGERDALEAGDPLECRRSRIPAPLAGHELLRHQDETTG